MFIHKMSITTLETGFLVQDETDPAEPHPLGGFGVGQLLSALSYVRDNMEYEMVERAKELAMMAAKHDGANVVPGPGWKPPPDWGGNVPDSSSQVSFDHVPFGHKDHTQAKVSQSTSGFSVVFLEGSERSALLDWNKSEAVFSGTVGRPTITRPIKTDREIVDEVNALAETLTSQQGFVPIIGTKYYVRETAKGSPVSSRVSMAWDRAVEIYEQITGSEVSDALQAVLEEESPPMAVPAEPVS